MNQDKNIDQLLNNIDGLLELTDNTQKLDIDKIAKQYREKQIREQIGNSKIFFGGFLFSLSCFFLTNDKSTKITMFIFFICMGIIYGLNHRAKKKILQQSFATTFSEFKEQRKKTAEILLKQYTAMRIPFYSFMISIIAVDVNCFLKSPDVIGLIVYSSSIVIGGRLIIYNVESSIKEFKQIIKS
jgi:hypothetical protein